MKCSVQLIQLLQLLTADARERGAKDGDKVELSIEVVECVVADLVTQAQYS